MWARVRALSARSRKSIHVVSLPLIASPPALRDKAEKAAYSQTYEWD